MYQYNIEYKKGSKLGNADALSRLPLAIENDIEPQNVHAFAETIPLNMIQVSEHTRKCKVLNEVLNQLLIGWKSPVNVSLKPFHDKRLMLSIENECIFYGNRIIIPDSLKTNILKMLHDTHIGVWRMKASARQYVWWPTVDKDIEAFARQCHECQIAQSSSSETPLSKWNETHTFFERIHLDFFHCNGKTILLVVDSYSRWFDVKQMKTTTSEKVINELRIIFAYFGLPKTVVSDNGPPFDAKAFLSFCNNNNIVCLKSPPYHPQSNGWAECGVRTVKQSLRKMLLESTNSADMQLLLSRFLIKYRNTPVTTTGLTPNERIFCFRPTILMDALICRTKLTHTEETKSKQKANGSKQNAQQQPDKVSETAKTYKLNQIVLYRNECKNEVKWLQAKIVGILSKSRYRIELLKRGSRRDCHGGQLRVYHENEFHELPISTPKASTQTEAQFVPCLSTTRQRKRDNDSLQVRKTSSRLRGKPRPVHYEARAQKARKRKQAFPQPTREI